MNRLFKCSKRFCVVSVGLVFFVAGMLKLMDPTGAGLVVDEYLKFFHLKWLLPLSKGIAVAFALVETLVGSALICGIAGKPARLFAWVLSVFFTFVTLILLIFNPEMDCGCFGEAVHLSHLQTFVKNLILCALLFVASLPPHEDVKPAGRKVAAFSFVALTVLVFTCYELVSLPLMDFTEYAPGANLSFDNASAVPDVSTEYVVIYEKDGQEGSFSLDHLPDSSWTFVRAEQINRTVPDYNQSTSELYLLGQDGEYHNELLTEERLMLISYYRPERFDASDAEKVNSFVIRAREAGFEVAVLSMGQLPGLDEAGYSADFKKIVTLNRSNGGVTYIDRGEIVRKWPSRSVPDSDDLLKIAESNPMETMVSKESKNRIHFQIVMLYSLALLLFV